MPMKGSTHDQTKTGDMVQVGSDDLTLFSRVTMRTTLAMQTLESGWLAWRKCFFFFFFLGGGGWRRERWTHKLPSSRMLTTASFWLVGICSPHTIGTGTLRMITSISMAAMPFPKKNLGMSMQVPTAVRSV